MSEKLKLRGKPVHKFVEMVKYMRPQGAETQSAFCNRYLLPVFGKPDVNGNYIKIIGHKPKICFAAHHDTVHKNGGMQKVMVRNDIVRLPENSPSNCLGADCTSGVYLILEMIKAKIPGVYVVHSAEEIGCVGSRALVNSDPDWLHTIDAVISFDRKGQESIITHQMGMRTCSDDFAISLDQILGLNMRPDDTGSYTDSNEYASYVPECTNLSVGYLAQHTARETQDLYFLDMLRDALIAADWSKLVIKRDPHDTEYLSYANSAFGYYSGNEPMSEDNIDDLYDVIRDNPRAIAQWLHDMNVTATDLVEELDLPFNQIANKAWLWT